MEKTTVAVSKETKEMLRRLGEKGESYDDIIRSLIEEKKIEKLDDRWNRILEEDDFIPLEEL
ncbi:MAG: antitoxin VapB family protein [Candidatus Thermoplasmatota archaeon]